MIVFSCAIAGSDRISLESKAVKIAKQHSKNLEIINFIDEMVKVANKTNPYINSKNIPNLDIENIRLLKENALKNIKTVMEENRKKDYIIDGHMSFWWRGGPLSLINSKDMRALNPDFFVSVLNDPNTVNKNLQKKKSWEDKTVDEYEIALWSELELYTADLISNSIGRKNYVIGSKEDPNTLYELIYRPDKPKAYISYTIEHRKSGYEALEKFIGKIKKYLIVFNPKAVDIDAYKENANERTKNLIFNQTVRRDFHLVDQTDITIVYLSDLVYSSGVDGERMHAHFTGKKVLLYFPFEKYSPFTPYFVDNMFKSETDLIKEIKELSKKYRLKQRQ